jgi:thiol:disulfide interchange protein
MAQTDDRSVSMMPKALIFVACVLLCARLIQLGISWNQGTQAPAQSVDWQTPPSLATFTAAGKKQAPPPVVPDLSPETIAEMEKIRDKSIAAGKPVLYEFYANWSDPCKKMESTSLSNSQIQAVIKERFYPVRITDRQKETGSNPKIITELQKKYRIFAFPTLVVIDSSGQPVGTLVGNCSSLTTYRFLSRALYGLRHPT